MDFFLKNVRETLEAINKLIENNVNMVNTKRIRRYNKIKASNRSKINFICRSLALLEENGVLEINGSISPRCYKIKPSSTIDVDDFITKLEKERK